MVGQVAVHSAESVAAMARELRLFQPDWDAAGQGVESFGC
ncbi:hypothetical protein I553_8484 [Mycobacterium xenopi 4042]|uniref:Uncharacterized protein n=1 Tax=Mycobacterium xenopi 4042 TaxID=1299334 RepID=X8CKS5_MYCXE|nr:hypothetical protein I553_8484 [Mycobacterium xenopi 4042]